MDIGKNDWNNRNKGGDLIMDEMKIKELQIFAGMEGIFNRDKGWVKGI